MFRNILVATDRHDVAEEPLRYRIPRGRRFLRRLLGIARELVFPTGPPAPGVGGEVADIELQSERATRHAIALARRHDARLHVLYTVDAVRYDTTVDFATEPLVEEGDAALAEIADAAERAGVVVTTAVEVGRPAALVLEYAAAHDIDLVVLNARDTGRLWWRLRGDLVSRVVRRSSVPVYVVPPVQPGYPD